MVINRVYEFTPPDGAAVIKVVGLQNYSPGQTRKVDLWILEAPTEYAAHFGKGIPEFERWSVLVATLANMFCDGNEKDASERLVLKYEDKSFPD